MTVASHRMILENPDAPGTGIIVAAGDEIPTYAQGYVENTPNKVDAARNMDVADAADQAATRPNERVVSRGASGASGQELAEIHQRVTANRREYDESLRTANDPQGWLPVEDDPAAGKSEPAQEGGSENAGEVEMSALEKLTVAQLDKLAEGLGDGVEDYGGNKAEKVKALSGKVTQSDISRLEE